MTSPSRRKRPTTVRGRSRPARMPASLLALTLLALPALAQPPAVRSPAPAPLPAEISRASQTLRAAQPAPAVRDPRLQQTQFRTPSNFLRTDETGQDFDVRFDLPGPDLLFRLDSENMLIERMKQERRKYKKEE